MTFKSSISHFNTSFWKRETQHSLLNCVSLIFKILHYDLLQVVSIVYSEWFEKLKWQCENKTVKAISIFLAFDEYEGKIPKKAEFDLLWKGGANYYYEIKKRWEAIKR